MRGRRDGRGGRGQWGQAGKEPGRSREGEAWPREKTPGELGPARGKNRPPPRCFNVGTPVRLRRTVFRAVPLRLALYPPEPEERNEARRRRARPAGRRARAPARA